MDIDRTSLQRFLNTVTYFGNIPQELEGKMCKHSSFGHSVVETKVEKLNILYSVAEYQPKNYF